MFSEDENYMKIALKLAMKGEGFTSPNPLVGAVVVNEGIIVGEGYHQYYGGPHAEVYALDEAGSRANGGSLYVNLEPCSHYGKTPPCSLKIIKSGIKRVVIAMKDPNPLVNGGGIEMLRKAGIEVVTGVLAEEAKTVNRVFIKNITTDLPYVYLKIAQTLDGFLATESGDSKWVTNEEARIQGHQLRDKVDAIIVGIGTVLKDNPSLKTRLPERDGKDSLRIILDSQLSLPLQAKIIEQKSSALTLVVTGKNVDQAKYQLLKKIDNVEIYSLELDAKGMIPLQDLLYYLKKRGVTSLLVEGGSKVNGSFLRAGLVDYLYAFIAPKIFGGNNGISSFYGEGAAKMADVKKLSHVSINKLGDNFLLTGELR